MHSSEYGAPDPDNEIRQFDQTQSSSPEVVEREQRKTILKNRIQIELVKRWRTRNESQVPPLQLIDAFNVQFGQMVERNPKILTDYEVSKTKDPVRLEELFKRIERETGLIAKSSKK